LAFGLSADRQLILQIPPNGSPSQRRVFEPSTLQLKSGAGDFVIGVKGSKVIRGQPAVAVPDFDAPDQQWTFVSVGEGTPLLEWSIAPEFLREPGFHRLSHQVQPLMRSIEIADENVQIYTDGFYSNKSGQQGNIRSANDQTLSVKVSISDVNISSVDLPRLSGVIEVTSETALSAAFRSVAIHRRFA
jgi:hypothetical protein